MGVLGIEPGPPLSHYGLASGLIIFLDAMAKCLLEPLKGEQGPLRRPASEVWLRCGRKGTVELMEGKNL